MMLSMDDGEWMRRRECDAFNGQIVQRLASRGPVGKHKVPYQC